MEDLAGKITELLGNPEMVNQIKQLSGLSEPQKSENKQESDSAGDNTENKTEDNFEFPTEMFQMLLKIGPILSSLNQEDKYTRFLKALKPLLSKERQKKIDSSSQILQIIKILPLLKNQDLF